ncbi:N-acetyltransferase [Streptomyces scabiei]|uniref:hypothetical protein n=1 Tax=Streptomyces scabiei TaxID=1930 RepID=UPI0038D3E7B8
MERHSATGPSRGSASAARAAAAGHPDRALWVRRENGPARWFYERAGFRPDGGEDTFTAGGVLVTEVRYVRPLTAPAAG